MTRKCIYDDKRKNENRGRDILKSGIILNKLTLRRGQELNV
jgi:hypothetical protein